MSEPQARVRGIVVAHGELATGLVGAVRKIAGERADGLVAISNDGKGPPELASEIDRVAGDDPVVVFADLQGGSCTAAALSCCHGETKRVVVGGVNLPMLVDFVFQEESDPAELASRVAERGRAAITLPRV